MAWENGETQISYHKLQQICEIYQISLQELLIEVENKSSTNTRKKRAKRKEVLLEYFS
jgi:transcriptional regulator with XRE-family HTH domain